MQSWRPSRTGWSHANFRCHLIMRREQWRFWRRLMSIQTLLKLSSETGWKDEWSAHERIKYHLFFLFSPHSGNVTPSQNHLNYKPIQSRSSETPKNTPNVWWQHYNLNDRDTKRSEKLCARLKAVFSEWKKAIRLEPEERRALAERSSDSFGKQKRPFKSSHWHFIESSSRGGTEEQRSLLERHLWEKRQWTLHRSNAHWNYDWLKFNRNGDILQNHKSWFNDRNIRVCQSEVHLLLNKTIIILF